jgi:nucleotide-binding universal stress UspA family protein
MQPPTPRRILVGLAGDGHGALSARDRHAFQQAVWLGKRTGAELRAFHVVDFADGAHGQDEAIQQSLADQLEALRGGAAIERVRSSQGITAGRASTEILREARRWRADVIAVGPRRRFSLGTRILHPSTMSRLLRGAETPVWVVQPDGRIGFERVLACVDPERSSARVVSTANDLCDLAGAQRIALSCIDGPDEHVWVRFPPTREALARYHQRERARVIGELEKLTGGAAKGWALVLDDRWVVEVVSDLVEARIGDLVVLAQSTTRALPGVAERILAHVPVSCWVVARGAATHEAREEGERGWL